jgi:hypothetical protein
MNAQTLPFKLYSRLINNKQQFLIHLRELHIVIDEGISLTSTQRILLPKLGFELNKDYFEVVNEFNAVTGHLLTFESALIYLNTFETTDKIKHCIKIIVQLLQRNLKESDEFIQNELTKQYCIVQTNAFLNAYFSAESYHFLLSEDDFIALERMKGACAAFEQMLLEINNNRTLSYEALSDLFSCCTAPLFNVLKCIKDVSNEVDKIRALTDSI